MSATMLEQLRNAIQAWSPTLTGTGKYEHKLATDLVVTAFVMPDEDPDTSYLGKFCDPSTKNALPREDLGQTVGRNEYTHYASCNYPDARPGSEEWPYVVKDANRLASFGEDWACVGIKAQLWFRGMLVGESSCLWGIEDDGPDGYLIEVIREQIEEALAEAAAHVAEHVAHWQELQAMLT